MISNEKFEFMNFLVESTKKFREYEISNKVMHQNANSSYGIDPIKLIRDDYYKVFNLELENKDLKDKKELFIARWGEDRFFYASSLEKLKIGFLIFSIIVMNYLNKNYDYTSIPYIYKDISKKELEELFYELFRKPIDDIIGIWDNYQPWRNFLTSVNPSLHCVKISNRK